MVEVYIKMKEMAIPSSTKRPINNIQSKKS